MVRFSRSPSPTLAFIAVLFGTFCASAIALGAERFLGRGLQQASFCRGKSSGYYSDPTNCGKFYQCDNGRTFSFSCPANLCWDNTVKVCNWCNLVKCGTTSGSGSTTGSGSGSGTGSGTGSGSGSGSTSTTSDSVRLPSGEVLTQTEFNAAVTRNGFSAPTTAQWNGFKGKLSAGDVRSKQEVAMILAHVIHETGGLKLLVEQGCNGGCSNYDRGDWCPAYPGVSGRHYYGRGYLQLSWNCNYGAASAALFGDPSRLLNNPDEVATNQDTAWATAFWFWKASVKGATWNPTVSQKAGQVTRGFFGASTYLINGALECGSHTAQATTRFNYYITNLRAFGLSVNPIESGCYN